MYWDDIILGKRFQDALTKAYGQPGANEIVYPLYNDVFMPFEFFKPEDTKIVILGQDPYHNGTADGLAFSSRYTDKCPASLRNILKSLNWSKKMNHYGLQKWATQGVLLLNTSLTVLEGKPNSHQKIWAEATIDILNHVRKKAPNCLYILMGKHAQKVGHFLPNRIECDHPSPLVRNSNFLKSDVFNKANDLLKIRGLDPIDWSL